MQRAQKEAVGHSISYFLRRDSSPCPGSLGRSDYNDYLYKKNQQRHVLPFTYSIYSLSVWCLFGKQPGPGLLLLHFDVLEFPQAIIIRLKGSKDQER